MSSSSLKSLVMKVPQSPGPDSGHQSMPLKTLNGVSGAKESRRASFGSGGTGPQPVTTPPVSRQEAPRNAPVNGAKELPHKAELEVSGLAGA